MQRRNLNATDAVPPAGAYTQAVEIAGEERTLYISGQIGAARDGGIPSDFESQARLVWQNIIAQLGAAGMTLDHLVKVTTIVPDPIDVPASRAIRGEILGTRRPASTLMIAGLANPEWKIEIEGIAVA